MSIYLLYSSEDADFAEKLSSDLVEHGIQLAQSNRNTDERFSALHKANKVIVVLSNHVSTDVRVLSTLSAAVEIQTEIIALRISQLDQTPKQLKGVFPLDFSNPDHYEDALETLIEDIIPPQMKQEASPSYLPEEVQDTLDNLEFASLKQRRYAIETLGKFRDEEDILLRSRAKDALSELVFKEKDGSLKRLASITLQSFDGDRESVIESKPPGPNEFVATLPENQIYGTEDVAVIQTAEPVSVSSVESLPMLPTEIWQTQTWLVQTHVMGILSAIGLVGFLGVPTLGFALGLIYIGLAWFNIQIRDNGQFVWRMPGPLVGNGLLGLILALIGVGLGMIFESQSLSEILGVVVLGVANGVFIGWISSLRM